MDQPLHHAMFADRVGQKFRIRLEAEALYELELIEATELPRRTPSSLKIRKDPFSLLFRACGEWQLTQRMCRLEHDHLDDFDLFLVPVGPGEYEAILN